MFMSLGKLQPGQVSKSIDDDTYPKVIFKEFEQCWFWRIPRNEWCEFISQKTSNPLDALSTKESLKVLQSPWLHTSVNFSYMAQIDYFLYYSWTQSPVLNYSKTRGVYVSGGEIEMRLFTPRQKILQPNLRAKFEFFTEYSSKMGTFQKGIPILSKTFKAPHFEDNQSICVLSINPNIKDDQTPPLIGVRVSLVI